VFWLQKPPYVRRIAAVLIVLAALAWELRPQPTELRPFLTRDVETGDPVTDDLLEWKEVPIGFFPELAEPVGSFVADFATGTPLVSGMYAPDPAVPPGWWALEVPVPAGTSSGTEVRLVVDVRLTPRIIPGLVIRLLGEENIDGFTALVAVPEEEVGAAAAALAEGSLRALIGEG
jgi:hypothetical protein